MDYPIYCPNYKFILLLEELELDVNFIIHPDIEHIKMMRNTKCKSVRELSICYLDSDISPIFIHNATSKSLLLNTLNSNRIKGVIAKEIKGHFVYDCEIMLAEAIVTDFKIPFTRLETIYDYHDSELIRVRLEAFAEMLKNTVLRTDSNVSEDYKSAPKVLNE